MDSSGDLKKDSIENKKIQIANKKKPKLTDSINDSCKFEADGFKKDSLIVSQKSPEYSVVNEYFHEISAIVQKLELSIRNTRQYDNQDRMRTAVLEAENQRLENELRLLRKDSKYNKTTLQHTQVPSAALVQHVERDDGHRSWSTNDVLRPTLFNENNNRCTLSIVHLQYKYDELWETHQNLLQSLVARDRDYRKRTNLCARLQNDVHYLKNVLLKKDGIIHDLCLKYMNLKKRRDSLEEHLRNEINSLQTSLQQAISMLHESCAEREVILTNKLHNVKDSKEALLLQEVRRTNNLLHENASLKHEINGLYSRFSQKCLPCRKFL